MSDSGSMNLDLGVNLGVTLDGAGLQELSNTIKEISKGKDLQRYWKDVESATDSAAKAIERYNKNVNSKGLAENLLKQINALKALTKKENLSELFPNMELNLDELVESARKIVPQINSQFSVDSFSQAFKTFNLLKEKSIDLTETFRKLADYADIVRRNSELSRENSQFRELIGDSDVEEVKSKLSEIKRLRDQAEEIFTSFLRVNNVERTDYWGDEKFSDYFDAIRKGSLTATEAISRFKTEYAYLLEEGFKSNNDTFGLEQLQTFSSKLDSIFRQVEETSTKINDIISNGVITKSVENLSMDSSLSDSQRSLFGNLLQDEESLKSITALFQKLIEESNKTSKVDLFNDEQLQQVLSIFDKMEGHLSSLRSIISDVGDGEEFSPLLKMINNVQSSISELVTSVKGIGLNMNIDVGSDGELDRKLQSKIANALQAYQKLFNNIKMSSAGGSFINQEFFDFNLDNYDTAYQKLQAIVNFIKKQRVEAKKQFNGYDALYEDSDKSLWKSAQAYLAQVTKAETEIKKANSGESNPLENLFGNTKDLSEVIEQLNKVVEKLNEISSSATEFKNIFKEGFNVTASVEEIDKLTNRVKELEDELSKIKLNPVSVDKSNISSENQVEKSIPTYEQVYEILNKIAIAYDGVTKNANEAQAVVNKLGDKISPKSFEEELIGLGNGIGKETITTKKLSLKKGGNSETITKEIDASNKLKEALSSVAVTYDNFENVLNTVCNILGIEIPQNANKAAQTIQQLGSQISSSDSWKNGLNDDEIRAVNKALDDMRNNISSSYSKDNMLTDLINTLNYIKTLSPDEFVSYIETLSSGYQNFINTVTHYRETNQQTLNGEKSEYNWKFNFEQYLKGIQSVTQAEQKLADVRKESSSTSPIKDVFQGEVEKSGMDAIASATEEAVQAKKDFATANEGVQSSIDGSKSPLQLEAKLMGQIAKSAREAADAKKEFVEANEKVKNSAAKSSNSLDKENSSLLSGHSENSEPSSVKKYQKKGYKAHDTGNHDNEKKVTNKAELGKALKELQSEIVVSIDETTSFIKEVTDFYDSTDNLVKTQMKVGDKNGSMRTYTTSYSMDKDGNATAWTSHIETQKIEQEAKAIQKLAEEKRKLRQQDMQSTQSSVDKALKDQVSAWKQIQSIREKIAKSNDANEIENLKKVKKEYQQSYIEADKILKTNSNLYDKEAQIAKLEQVRLETNKKIADYKNPDISSMESSLARFEESSEKLSLKPDNGHSFESWKLKIDELNNAINEYRNKITELQNKDGIIDKEDISEATDLENKIKSLLREMQKTSSGDKGFEDISATKIAEQIHKLLEDNTAMSRKAKAEIQAYYDEVASGKPGRPLKEIYNDALKVVQAERAMGREGKSFLDTMKDKAWYGWAAQITSMFGVYDIINIFKQGINTLKEFDDGLTKISYTMDMTKSQLDSLGKSVLEMANDLDSSINNAMQVSQIYANMNTSAEEIKKLSEPTLILSNLTGFDASTVADDIQAVTQQFDIAAESSMHIADVYDQISRNISVDYSKGIESIAEAVQVAGSTADQAGLSFEQLAAIVGKTVEKTRLEGSQVGNGLKTIMTRLSKVGKLSEEVDNETLSQASESLKKVGIEVYNLDGSYREFDVIMGELASKWDGLTDAEKSNISFNIAATRQTNLLSAVLSNFSDSMQLAEEATNANGNALENNQKWVDSFGGHLQSLENTAKSAWINILDSETIKGGVDLLNILLERLTKFIDTVGVLPTLAGIGGVVAGFKNVGIDTLVAY